MNPKNQSSGAKILILTCVLVLYFAAQPLSKLALPEVTLGCQLSPMLLPGGADGGLYPTMQSSSCELNGKWLSAAIQLCAEPLLFSIPFFIILLLIPQSLSLILPNPVNKSPPERRLHLTLCVWRE